MSFNGDLSTGDAAAQIRQSKKPKAKEVKAAAKLDKERNDLLDKSLGAAHAAVELLPASHEAHLALVRPGQTFPCPVIGCHSIVI